MGFLRDAGLNPAGAQVVDLLPGVLARPQDVAEQSVARLRAALARVSGADIGAPVAEAAAVLGPGRVSRRDLFGLGHLGRRPIAAWTADRCQGRGASRLCAQVCPSRALSATGPGVSVDASSCSGCGACVAACRSGAMSLSGASMADFEAAAGALVEDACRLGLGLAIVCSSAATKVTLGGLWLALEVPSLEDGDGGLAAAGCRRRACRDGPGMRGDSLPPPGAGAGPPQWRGSRQGRSRAPEPGRGAR